MSTYTIRSLGMSACSSCECPIRAEVLRQEAVDLGLRNVVVVGASGEDLTAAVRRAWESARDDGDICECDECEAGDETMVGLCDRVLEHGYDVDDGIPLADIVEAIRDAEAQS